MDERRAFGYKDKFIYQTYKRNKKLYPQSICLYVYYSHDIDVSLTRPSEKI
jgi:hypothetical protein